MSWTMVFPVLTDELLEEFDASASDQENSELDEWFAVGEILNRNKLAHHVVSFSLFWKNARQSEPDLPPLDRQTLMRAKTRGLVRRHDPWNHYFKPLVQGARQILAKREDICLRVYLAADLEFLAGDLVRAGCEVRLMKSSSVRHNPGAMWRFLALEEPKKLVTMCDSDRAPVVGPDILRTEQMALAGLGLWRVPVWGDLSLDGTVPYRPMFGGQFGACLQLPMRRLMKAFIWHGRRGSISLKCSLPGCGERPINGGSWPDYGFDEFFLTAAVYPRAARRGVLSFIPTDAKSSLLPLDVEYVTWANPRSEIVYFQAGAPCCAPPATSPGSEVPDGSPGLMKLDDFPILESSALSLRHPLPPWASRAYLGRDGINGHVWAWFNPSSVFWRGKRWLAYRTECSPRWHWSRISLAVLDREFRVVPGSNRLLKLKTAFGTWGAEDPRLTVCDDRLFLSYTDGRNAGLAEVNGDGTVATSGLFSGKGLVSDPMIGKDKREKNWGFFGNDNGFFVSYWVAPHVVLRCDPARRRLSGERWESLWSPPVRGPLHGGSPPTFHDGLFWRVVHSYETGQGEARRYQLWLMAFEVSAPFKPRWFCRKPLVVAEPDPAPLAERTIHQVVFCGSAERAEAGWRIFFGDNDRRIRHGIVADELIQPNLVKID